MDGFGREVIIPEKLERGVIGLSPAVTEILAQVVPPDMILARTKACDFPEWIMEKESVESYPLDIESIISLDPEIIFSEEGIIPEDALKKLKEFGIESYIFRFESPGDISDAFLTLAKIFPELSQNAEKASNHFHTALEKERVREMSGKTALGLIWTEPIYVFGHNTILSSELELIGLTNAIDSVFSVPYPEISREYLLKIDPDIIFGLEFQEFDKNLVQRFPELRNLTAFRDSTIFEVNPDLFTRPSPRIPILLAELKSLALE